MAQAAVFNIKDRKRIQPVRRPKLRDASGPVAPPPFANSEGFDDLESELLDVKQMAQVAVTVIENTLQAERCDVAGKEDCYWIPDQQREMAVFSVSHLQHLIAKLEERYFALLEETRHAD